MKKKIVSNEAYYTIAWSPVIAFNKYSITRVLPELPGIVLFSRNSKGRKPIFIYGCWREGIRLGIKYLFDPAFSKVPKIAYELLDDALYFKYTVIDTDIKDMQDVMSLLILKYKPQFNNTSFKDSGRYAVIHLRETEMKNGEVVEKIPQVGF